MNYENVFWFYDKKLGEGSIYDGRKRKERTLSNGVKGFSIEPIWQGECTEAELHEKVNEYEKNTNKNYGQNHSQLSDGVAIASD